MKKHGFVPAFLFLGFCGAVVAQEETTPVRYLVTVYSFRALGDVWTPRQMTTLTPDAQVAVGNQILTLESRPAYHKGVKIVTRGNRWPLWDGVPEPTDPRIIPLARPQLAVVQDAKATIVVKEKPPMSLEPSDREGASIGKGLGEEPWFRLSLTVSPGEGDYVQVAVEQEVSFNVGRIRQPGNTLDVGPPVTQTSFSEGTIQMRLGHWLCMSKQLDPKDRLEEVVYNTETTQGYLVTFLRVTQPQDASYPTLEAGAPQLGENGVRPGLQYQAEAKVIRVPAASSSTVADALVFQRKRPVNGVQEFRDVLRGLDGVNRGSLHTSGSDKPANQPKENLLVTGRAERLTTVDQVVEFLDSFDRVELVTAPRVTTFAVDVARTRSLRPDGQPQGKDIPVLSSIWPPPEVGEVRPGSAIIADMRTKMAILQDAGVESGRRNITTWNGTIISFWGNPSKESEYVNVGFGYHHRSLEKLPRKWWQWTGTFADEERSFYRELTVPENGWVGFTYEMSTTGDRIVILLSVDEVEPEETRFYRRTVGCVDAPPAQEHTGRAEFHLGRLLGGHVGTCPWPRRSVALPKQPRDPKQTHLERFQTKNEILLRNRRNRLSCADVGNPAGPFGQGDAGGNRLLQAVDRDEVRGAVMVLEHRG